MAKSLPSRADIVRCLTSSGRALHAREIASLCDAPEGSYPHVFELLDQLSFEGTIRRLAGNRYRARGDRAAAAESWEGVLKMNPRGFGFVTAVGQDDVYVAPDAIGGALHGDHVRISIVGRSSRGVEGRVEAVVTRRNPRVAGVLRRRGRSSWLEPDDTRMRGPVVLPGLTEGRDGEAAVVSITRFPDSHDENPEAELVALLGMPGDPNTEVAKILVREQIVEAHPEGAVREAETMAARLLRNLPSGRVDLRDVPLPTIDPEDARDHDDAVWVERRDGGYRVWIAIADVSEYVQEGTELDQEALRRGCTIYLPDRAIPMLPAALAADLCSLLPDRERLCLCVIADLDKDAKVQDFEIVEGVMRSAAMLTYGGVARALGFTETPPRSAQAEALKRDLRVVDEVSRKLRRGRLRRGALDLDLPEARVHLDPESGAPTGVSRRAEDAGIKRAYQMVEELMLLANELVAKWLSRQRCPTIYRVHGKPDETKLERLGEIAPLFGVEVDVQELLEPKGLSKWLRDLEEHPKKNVLEMLLLRSLKQASYDIVNIGHFGLASDNYLHFTSPIRRYPDLLVHRTVKRLLRGHKPDTSPAAVEALRLSATRSSERERAAMEVEREVVDLYRAIYMQGHLNEIFEGMAVAVVGSGMYVQLGEPFVDVLVRFESMGPDQYELTEDELGVVGVRSGDRVNMGDPVTVQIEDVALLRRAVYARRLEPQASDDASTGRRRRRSAPEPSPSKGKKRVVRGRPAAAAATTQARRPKAKSTERVKSERTRRKARQKRGR